MTNQIVWRSNPARHRIYTGASTTTRKPGVTLKALVLPSLTLLICAVSSGCAPRHDATPTIEVPTRPLTPSRPLATPPNIQVDAPTRDTNPDTTPTATTKEREPVLARDKPAKTRATDTKQTEKKKKARKKKKMSRKQVREANAELIAGVAEDLPARSFAWDSIVIHHTASEWSSLARIDAFHRRKFEDPDGIEYHFLIGNGKKAPDGLIELGRWPLQKRSIHLFKPEGWPASITISLVGNFHERELERAQFDALRDLVIALANTYDIPAERITTHTEIDGRLTVCPGKHFPYKKLMKQVTPKLEGARE